MIGVCGGDGSVAAVAHVARGRAAAARRAGRHVQPLRANRGCGIRRPRDRRAPARRGRASGCRGAGVRRRGCDHRAQCRVGRRVSRLRRDSRTARGPMGQVDRRHHLGGSGAAPGRARHRGGRRASRPRVEPLRRRGSERSGHRGAAPATAARRRCARRAGAARRHARARGRLPRVRASHECGAPPARASPPPFRGLYGGTSTSSCAARGTAAGFRPRRRGGARGAGRGIHRFRPRATARRSASCRRHSTCTGRRRVPQQSNGRAARSRTCRRAEVARLRRPRGSELEPTTTGSGCSRMPNSACTRLRTKRASSATSSATHPRGSSARACASTRSAARDPPARTRGGYRSAR